MRESSISKILQAVQLQPKLIIIISTSKRCKNCAKTLLRGQGYFVGDQNTRRIHTSLHPGPEWRIFRMLRSRVAYR